MAKVSGKEVAEAILKKLEKEIEEKKLKPSLAIILAGDDLPSRVYVSNKIKTAKRIGIKAKRFEFKKKQYKEVLHTINKLNRDKKVHGIIIQYPVYKDWDFDNLINKVDLYKDVDGFRENSPYKGATAMAVWEMLTAFAYVEKFKKTEDFLKGKKIIILGKGKTAGGPTTRLLEGKGFKVTNVVKETEKPDEIVKTGDIVISATGVRNIVGKRNLKEDAYVVGLGFSREPVNGKQKLHGDINEEEVSKIARLYCPTIGGIGPLTIVSLLKNVVESAKKARN